MIAIVQVFSVHMTLPYRHPGTRLRSKRMYNSHIAAIDCSVRFILFSTFVSVF